MTLLKWLLDCANPAEQIEIVSKNVSLGVHTKGIWNELLTLEAKRSEATDFYSDYDRDNLHDCCTIITIKPLTDNLLKEVSKHEKN